MNKKRQEDIWIKNWSGNWSFLFCSFYGKTYTYGLKKYLGASFKNFFIQFEEGVGSNYLLPQELSRMGKHFSGLVISNPKITKIWVAKTIQGADAITGLLNRLQKKKIISPNDYKELDSLIHKFTPFNFAIKRVIDYLPAKLQAQLLPDFEYARVYTENIYNNIDKVLVRMLSSIAKKTGYQVKFLKTITTTEIEKYFRTGKLPLQEELKERYQGVAVFYKNGGEKVIFGKKFIDFKEELISRLMKQRIKGTPAYLGKAKGVVRVVLDPFKVKEFNQGDILVTGMTRPDYLPLMKKSAAFITDAGGMLSHAAIMARELKKPCIVGAEIATKILKDGDIVEVDAKEGAVNILKRS